jgi:high-affinity iron transporter
MTWARAALERALLAARSVARWRPTVQAPLAARQAVNSATGALLETLSSVPDLLEVRPA